MHAFFRTTKSLNLALGIRLARNYARLAESFLLKDREPEYSIILFSVQLLTVPSVADVLVNQYDFFNLILCTLSAFFLSNQIFLLQPFKRLLYPSRVNCELRAFRTRRYFNAFHDLRYIMNVDMIKPVLIQDPLCLRQFLEFLSMFQGMNAQVCQKDTHVEYESELWVNAFNVALQIAKCCRQLTDCIAALPQADPDSRRSAAQTLIRALTQTLTQINTWDSSKEELRPEADAAKQPGIAGPQAQTYKEVQLPYVKAVVQVIDYNITEKPVSFHHALHWLLAGLLEHAHLLDDATLLQLGYPGGFPEVLTLFKGEASIERALLPIIEYPIRTIAFSAQIRAGVWVRNGYGIRNQVGGFGSYRIRHSSHQCFTIGTPL